MSLTISEQKELGKLTQGLNNNQLIDLHRKLLMESNNKIDQSQYATEKGKLLLETQINKDRTFMHAIESHLGGQGLTPYGQDHIFPASHNHNTRYNPNPYNAGSKKRKTGTNKRSARKGKRKSNRNKK